MGTDDRAAYSSYIGDSLRGGVLLYSIYQGLQYVWHFCVQRPGTLRLTGYGEGGFMAVRAFLGLCEGGMMPGVAFYLSTYYKRHELVLRIGIFGGSSLFSNCLEMPGAKCCVGLQFPPLP